MIFIAPVIGVDMSAHGLVIFKAVALIDGVILGLNENILVYKPLGTLSDVSAIFFYLNRRVEGDNRGGRIMPNLI